MRRVCKQCSKVFQSRTKHSFYCSIFCRNKYYRLVKYKSYFKAYKKKFNNRDRKRYLLKNPWYLHLWSAKQRCNYRKNCSYKYYGGRGIKCYLTIADIKTLWLRDKACKLVKPSIDRINREGHYEMANCRFIEHSKNISRKWL